MSMKNPLTPAGIEPATSRFVAKHLNRCTTAVPNSSSSSSDNDNDINNLLVKMKARKLKYKSLCIDIQRI